METATKSSPTVAVKKRRRPTRASVFAAIVAAYSVAGIAHAVADGCGCG